jgi:hypothetical protein
VRRDGNLLRTIGVATMKPARQRKPTAFTITKCLLFANCSNEDEIYPLTTADIAAAQQADASLKHLFKCNAVIDQGLEIKLIENMTCVCKDGQLVIPKPLQVCAIKWYHHNLQHSGHTRLEETMNTAMYWKGMRTIIRSLTKSCKSCQVNKRWSQKYGHLPPKTVYTIPWECLCVDLIGPYTLKGKDNLQIDFMALTMIEPLLLAGSRLQNRP